MGKGRLEAFSDGVIAIIITIMALELRAPHGDGPEALRPLIPVFLGYALSYAYVGIYWSNHHHMLQAVQRVDGRVLWANLHLLFWLSLIPFATAWMGDNHFAPWPVATYGAVLLLAATAYYILSLSLIRLNGASSKLASAVGSKLKERLSLAIYLAALPLAFASAWIACGLYVFVAIIWFVPDRRIEKALAQEPNA